MSTLLRLVDAPGEGAGFHGLIGSHPLMRRLFEEITAVAPLPVPVMVQGATGTGKELVVRALHRLSQLPGRLVPVNMAALPEALAESELFGAVRGAFTGAVDRAGVVEEADRGTLYLDEAADATPMLQAKLLRVIENGVVHRVGCRRDRPVRVRLVVSIQRRAEELVAQGRWRDDFYYRIAGVTLQVPSLRDRVSDVPTLINHFLGRLGRPGFLVSELDPLLDYRWAGNVRELIRIVERAVFMAGRSALRVAHLASALTPESPRAPSRVEEAAENDPGSFSPDRLLALCRDCEWDAQQIATALGVGRTTLFKHFRRLGISLRRDRAVVALSGVRDSSR